MRRTISFNLFIGVLFMCIYGASAQTSADARKVEIEKFMRFPVNVSLSQDFISSGGYKMQGIGRGTFSNAFKTALNLSMPIYKSRMGMATVGGFYNFHNVKFSPNQADEFLWHPNMGRKHHTWGLQSAYMLNSKLMGRQFVGIINVRGEFSEQGFERATGVAVGMLQIKKTEYSSLGVGAVFLINTSSPWPLFPFATYRCRFDDKWSLDLMLPRLYINYRVSQKDKLSAGLFIFGEHFYVTPGREELPSTCLYSRSNLRPEFVYEHNVDALTKFFIKGGATICINSHLYSSGGNTKFVEISQNPSLFLQIGMSYGMRTF